jgi:hypothetical protein
VVGEWCADAFQRWFAAIELLQADETAVDLVNRAAYQMPDAAIVGRIVRAEGLAEEWKDMVSARLNRMRLTNPTYHFATEFAEVGG